MPLKLTTYYHGKDIPDLPGNNTFHSKELFQIYEATPGYSPLLIVATEDGKPVARLLAAIRKTKKWLPSCLVKQCVVYGEGEFLKRHLQPNRKIRFRTSGKERKKCSVKCWNISRKRHPVPVSLSNSAIWTTLCSVTVLSGTTTIFRSTGYGYAIRYIVRKKRKTVSARHVSAR